MATNISNLNLNAPIKKVWDTLTQPSQVKLWQFGSDLTTDWEVGSDIRFTTAWEGQIFEQWGKILEIIPNEKLKYSLFAPRPDLEDKPENYFVISYILTQEHNHVKLQIIQEDNRVGAKQEAPQGEENPILKGLKDLIEG
jgi:uncharacterized protein YndB with AHSA1/START domain